MSRSSRKTSLHKVLRMDFSQKLHFKAVAAPERPADQATTETVLGVRRPGGGGGGVARWAIRVPDGRYVATRLVRLQDEGAGARRWWHGIGKKGVISRESFMRIGYGGEQSQCEGHDRLLVLSCPVLSLVP